ncbi:MAG: kinase/pyrophosphorylase [Calditrichia bacterium]|nr:kinase/pyrophosphorylase [Calditrichia bacterium]
MKKIHVLSDGSGMTGKQALTAALTQFSGAEVEIIVRRKVRTHDQITQVVKEAKTTNSLVMHTVVSTSLRNYILEMGRLHGVETYDLMGPLLAVLSQRLADSPAEKPGLFHELNKAYFQRIEAMEYSFRHDDGLRTEELNKAEIVLVGVSRTFKTPLSIYLAFKGWRVANIPIILGIEPPPELLKIDPLCVFGLMTNANRLSTLRQIRHEYLGSATGDYAELKHVVMELGYAKNIFTKQPDWHILNVTNKPIEEIASEILSVMSKRGVTKSE